MAFVVTLKPFSAQHLLCGIRHLKQDDAFSRTWWSVLSIDELVTWQRLSIERTGGHVVSKASSCLRSLLPQERGSQINVTGCFNLWAPFREWLGSHTKTTLQEITCFALAKHYHIALETFCCISALVLATQCNIVRQTFVFFLLS